MMEEGENTVKLRQVKPIVVNDGVNTNYGRSQTPDMTSGQDNPAFDLEAGAEDQQAKANGNLKDEEDYNSSDDEYEDEVLYGNAWSRGVKKLQTAVFGAFNAYNEMIWSCIYVCLLTLYMAYFVAAMVYRFGDEGSWRLLVCTILLSFYVGYYVLHSVLGDKITIYFYWSKLERDTRNIIFKWSYIILCILLALGAVIYVIVEIALKTPENLISLSGMAFFIIVFYIFSHNPARVNWRPVFWGLILQFYFAVAILRWGPGYEAFRWLGDRVSEFLLYTDEGSKFVFGEAFTMHFFAFKVLTVIVFFSSFISVLYYLGVMQFIIRHIARFMATVMGTSPAESLNAAGNIFIGQSEAPLLIRPFLSKMTRSELHAICTGGFATIAGSVMAAYIIYKVPANHLLSASVMSAPAALAMSKLFYPETRKSRAGKEVYNMASGQERNIIEAASKGASQSISLIANIAVNLIAFIALVEFLNQTLIWFGNRIGMEKPDDELTFQFLCSYVFYPVAFLMGVDQVDCFDVAQLIGYKTFINEFYAYTKLSVFIKNQENLTWYESLRSENSTFTGRWHFERNDIVYEDFNHTLVGGVLQDRSVVIATYALCGFSNIGSIGVMLGALGAMAPKRQTALAQVVIRAMIAGNVACFMTACIAGLLYEPGK
ncbi:solute carrier family 28 member 3-like [Ostrea edulis]|uniref:solute carrier family 28 member 3-like n=1 Tax=Ostrea edulis TaxID=37623 RepID=UPI0024AEBAF6|nr:solute carrier family 28 member 3-like [Ostrea edulis]